MAGTNVKVCCRFRPPNKVEAQSAQDNFVIDVINENTVNVGADIKNKKTFNFDHVFPPNTAQLTVFECAALPLVDAVLTGYNCTLFAYGQTGSGKTYTMEGDVDSDEHSGLIPRMVRTIFNRILDDDSAQNGNREYMVRVSFIEIYNERLRDLLNPSDEDLRIRDGESSNRGGVYIEGAHSPYVSDPDEVFSYLHTGHANRSVTATRMNEHSSRSHAVFMLQIEMKDVKSGSLRKSKLMMVDLAGSEKVRKTNATGQTLKEAQQINKSLMTLGRVISALVEDKGHVPYRDSKLTRLLSDALGGNSKTCLIVTASPAEYNEEETISTLRFGQSAKSIKNRVKINAELSVSEYKKIVAKLQYENKQLKLTIKKMQIQLDALANAAKDAVDVDTIMNSAVAHIKDNTPEPTNETTTTAPPPKKSRRASSRELTLTSIGEHHPGNLSSGSLFSEPPEFLNATEEKVSELTEQLEDLREEYQDMKNSHSALEAEKEELKNQLLEETEKAHAWEAKWNELNKIYQTSARMNGEHNNKIKNIEHENDDMSKRIDEYETENFQLKNELQQRDYEIESLLKELKLVKRKLRQNRQNITNKDESNKNNNELNTNDSSDETIEDMQLTMEGDKDANVKTTNDKDINNISQKPNDKKIRYITEVQVKALEDEWIKKLRKKDNELKKLKEKCRQYMQKNEMNRNLREDWKVQLEEMKKAVLLQQKIMDTEKDRHTKEIYERDVEIVRLKSLVAVFTRQNVKNYQKNRQNHTGNSNSNTSVVRAPVILRGGQRRREQNVLRQMNIDVTDVDNNEKTDNGNSLGKNTISEQSPQIQSESKSDLE